MNYSSFVDVEPHFCRKMVVFEECIESVQPLLHFCGLSCLQTSSLDPLGGPGPEVLFVTLLELRNPGCRDLDMISMLNGISHLTNLEGHTCLIKSQDHSDHCFLFFLGQLPAGIATSTLSRPPAKSDHSSPYGTTIQAVL